MEESGTERKYVALLEYLPSIRQSKGATEMLETTRHRQESGAPSGS